MKFPDISTNKGVAIVAVTMVLVVAALLGGAMLSQTTQDINLTNRSGGEKEALFLAESAKEHAYRLIRDEGVSVTGALKFVTEIQEGETEAGTISHRSIPTAGSYSIKVTQLASVPATVIRIVGTGDSGIGKKRQVTVVSEVMIENLCVWNNAVFGGSGGIGGVINGNCAIHGSVHLLGDGVGEGGTAIEAIDLSGTALIHNNYDGMNAVLQPRVPSLPVNDDGLGTLNAKLRVRNGAVGISGNSEIGQSQTETTAKGPMNGIYIETSRTDLRWTGTAVDENQIPDPTKVFSDNGIYALYDLGEIIEMPTIDEPYYDSWTNTTFPSGYTQFFEGNVTNIPLGGNRPGSCLQLPGLVLDGSNSAAMTIQAESLAGRLPGVTIEKLDSVTGEFRVSSGGNYIEYDPDAGGGNALLTVGGMIEFKGDLTLGWSTGGNKADIIYSGDATLYAVGNGTPGNITIDGNLLPATVFPTGDVIGLVAYHDIYLGADPGGAQLLLTGAFYAGHQVVSRKQTQVCGTFVCTFFDMGTNIPRIFQVPSLIENFPPGLIGSDPFWVVTEFDEKSWRTDIVPGA